MKKINLIILAIFPLIFFSCIDVIELDVPEGKRRLVVEGMVTDQEEVQTITLKYTAPYFSNEAIPMVKGAEVKVITEDGEYIVFDEKEEGIYQKEFKGQIGVAYSLYIKLNDGTEYVSGLEKMEAVPEIDSIYFEFQKAGFRYMEDGYYVTTILSDPKGIRNFYRWIIYNNDSQVTGREGLMLSEDRIYDGMEKLDAKFNTPFQLNDVVKVRQLSISEKYFNYLNILLRQVYNSGSQFDAPPAPIIGNIYLKDKPEEYALGYFHASAVSIAEIIIEEKED
jgi:hypothetical protein